MRSILDIHEDIASGKLSIYDLVESYLETIRQKDEDYNAFINVYDEMALQIAIELDRNKPNDPPYTYGIPIAIKDNIAVKDMELTCASRILLGFKSPYDATSVKRLKSAGMIVLGKTNMDEFAMGSTSENSYFGAVRNAINREWVAGGSSGGSAVAVALGEVPVSLGSDTGGSVRQPSAFNGVVGLKPTYGRVSRYGLVSFASSMDQIGPIATNVKDVALIYTVIAGYDPKDATSSSMKVENFDEIFLQEISSFRIGIPYNLLEGRVDDAIMERFEEVVSMLRNLGHEVRKVDLPNARYSVEVYHIISSSEASSNLLRYDGVRYGYRKDSQILEDMYVLTRTEGFGEEVKRRIVVGTFSLSEGYMDEYYVKASKVRRLIRNDFMKAFEEGLDIILLPTTPTFPWKIGEKLDIMKVYASDSFTTLANLTGLPALSIPVGLVGGKPVSVQLIANYFQEIKLFRLGEVLHVSFNA